MTDTTIPNPLAPVKGANTTFWMYNSEGDPFASPLSDNNWLRLANVKRPAAGRTDGRCRR
ncbi:major tail protein [Salmonella enterica subsp. enterica]|nr:major tail protein [Salmonella enterica subsp. enterica]